ncbi:MAG: hypothetical protein SPL42_04555 [Bacteroidales bacterium]|nr:hypothetical protein [Bacteroidales bacterium]
MIDIIEVDNKKLLEEFIRFPKSLYKGNPYWVPPLDNGETSLLTRHPALEFCDLKMWLARKDGKTVGRIAGIVNRRCNELKLQRRVRFSWFDFIEDIAVAEKLLETVEDWGKSLGMDEICGPSRYSNMEKQAMLVEGFDHIASIGADFNHEYYPQFMERLNFEKEVDYIQYKVKVTPVQERMTRIADILQEKYTLRLRKFENKRQLKKAAYEFFEVVNSSYKDIFNFIPLTNKEMEWLIDQNMSVGIPELMSFLEDRNGRLVGIAMSLPSLNEAFKKADGKLLPFGIFHIFKALKHNKNVDLLLTGVIPEYAHTGVHAIYHKYLHEQFLKKGYEYAFTSQQLEDNIAARIWQKYDAEIISRRRCYKKDIR